MGEAQLAELGRQRLSEMEAATEAVASWRSYLQEYKPRGDHADDTYAWLSCVLALEGVATGNFGVGALLVDAQGYLVVHGHNEVFQPRFRSDRHAEMVVLDRFEDAAENRARLSLYTSVEPCPMCLTRLSSSAVHRVHFVAPDGPGGMVHRMDGLPPFWQELARGKAFAQAHCSQDLVQAASQIFLSNLSELTQRLKAQPGTASTRS
jgi:cytosine deaminase